MAAIPATGTAPSVPWMIYGANGYTGELITREAVRRGLKPVLAGRNPERIAPLARELDLQARCFGLDDAAQAATQIRGQQLVLHCAGPFSATAEPMMDACLQARAHYLDITGEIAVLERAQALHARARSAGIVICPGVGFDVIPTDCIAASLARAMPDATHLALGFDSRSALSPGTLKTQIEGLALGGRVRRAGKIIAVPLASHVRTIDFGAGEKRAMSIPWGDVSTAFHTTAIPDIEVFIPASARTILGLRLARFLRPLLALPRVQALLKARIERTVRGPAHSARAQLPTFVWGEVRNAHGQRKSARIRTDNVYNLTVNGALAVVEHLLGNPQQPGAWTPARLLGADLIVRLPCSGPIEIS